MTNWKVTATTIYCDAVDDEVTLLVYQDGSAKCASAEKYGRPGKETARLLGEKSRQLKRPVRCEGPECSRLTGYRDKLFAEDTGQVASGGD